MAEIKLEKTEGFTGLATFLVLRDGVPLGKVGKHLHSPSVKCGNRLRRPLKTRVAWYAMPAGAHSRDHFGLASRKEAVARLAEESPQMKTLTENDYCDLTENDYDFLQDREPDETISTGFDATYATELQIYFNGTTTIVVPVGEHENCEGWKFEKRVSAKAALRAYRKECKDEDAEDDDYSWQVA